MKHLWSTYSTLSLKTETQVHNFCPVVVHSAVDERWIYVYKVQCDSVYYWNNARILEENKDDTLKLRISSLRSSA